MSERAQERTLGQSLRAALSEQAGAARYEQYQQEIRGGARGRPDGPRPREFDENGFPLPQRNASFLERVTRLLNSV
jgi:hypothetical protein